MAQISLNSNKTLLVPPELRDLFRLQYTLNQLAGLDLPITQDEKDGHYTITLPAQIESIIINWNKINAPSNKDTAFYLNLFKIAVLDYILGLKRGITELAVLPQNESALIFPLFSHNLLASIHLTLPQFLSYQTIHGIYYHPIAIIFKESQIPLNDFLLNNKAQLKKWWLTIRTAVAKTILDALSKIPLESPLERAKIVASVKNKMRQVDGFLENPEINSENAIAPYLPESVSLKTNDDRLITIIFKNLLDNDVYTLRVNTLKIRQGIISTDDKRLIELLSPISLKYLHFLYQDVTYQELCQRINKNLSKGYLEVFCAEESSHAAFL